MGTMYICISSEFIIGYCGMHVNFYFILFYFIILFFTVQYKYMYVGGYKRKMPFYCVWLAGT